MMINNDVPVQTHLHLKITVQTPNIKLLFSVDQF